MKEPAELGAEITDLRKRVGEAVAHLSHAASQMAAYTTSGPAYLVADVLSDAPAVTEKAARLVVAFERIAVAVADDFDSIDQFRGPENLAGLLSDAARQKARAARVRQLALPARLDALLSGAGTVCRLLDEKRAALRAAREACEGQLERLTQQAISASNELEDTQRRLGAFELDLTKTKGGFRPSTGREAAAALAEGHAGLAADHRAAATRIAGLRKTREEAEGRIAATEPLFAGLSREIAALDAVRHKLATDLESGVLLYAAVRERMRHEYMGSAALAWPSDDAEIIAELIALQARGALSVRDIERRKITADAAFAGVFPQLVEISAEPPDEKHRWRLFSRRNGKRADR